MTSTDPLDPATIDPATIDTATIDTATIDTQRWRVDELGEPVADARLDDPDECYRSLEHCLISASSVLLRSLDGAIWDVVDLAGRAGSTPFSIESVVGSGGGVTVVGAGQNGLSAWTWTGPASPRVLGPPPPLDELEEPLATWDGMLDVGVLYRFPLGLHCGMEHLGNFNGSGWTIVDGSAPVVVETGAGDDPPVE